jgi:hypothetical protein
VTKKWNVLRFAAIGFVLGGAYATYLTSFLHSDARISHMPIVFDIFGGLLGLVVFGGAAIAHNRYADSVPKAPD